MIKYLGSKRLLIPGIEAVMNSLPFKGSVIDLFSGTSRVGLSMKQLGWKVLLNDWNQYARVISTAHVVCDEDRSKEVHELIQLLETASPIDGWFTETYCRKSRYFTPENGIRIEGIREFIETLDLDDELKCVAICSLMEAADRVDSTVGVQMAYLKQWSKRSLQTLKLRPPALVKQSEFGKASAHCMEAQEAASKLIADVAYLDPPYNQHKYIGNYHVWQTLVQWDQPEVYGIACKRVECREKRSDFNSKPGIQGAMNRLIENLQCEIKIISFSNEGYLPRTDMESLLLDHGKLQVLSRAHDRYVGAKIGIHAPSGKKVGQVSHLKNTEFLYVLGEVDLSSGICEEAGWKMESPLQTG
ncbi:MAG: DNA adenine methylase [Planctomycetia bacterium]|nr:DNA adenine methylase [Planctomycetia bacterium]MBL6914991.1 DNA adenine methylase [Planctomycetota bacterium]MDG1454988.1 DNA adenine methylase [Planctomycetota bacterium]MDG2083788.1 DNA adenine methylase [Planctomycetota bacterium]HCW45305.1 DNA methyltransferase [Planctomycetota bacterium]